MIKILILTGGSICMTTMLIAQLHMVAPTEATETSSAVLAKHIIDSTIYKHIQDGDSLKYQITQQVNTSTSYLIHTTDSLIRSTEDCLTSSSVDSLKQLQTSFLHSLQDYGALQQRSIDSTVRDRSTDLERYYWSAKHQSNSFNTTESIHDFFNTADSLSQFFRDSIMELYSIITGGLMDTTSFFQDSLATYTDRLTVDRESELDAIERSSSHIIVETESNSYPSYHGRDGGVRQISFSPTMTYRHTSGASLSVGSTWFEKQAAHWDETEAQIGYDYFSSSTLEASLAYTHFWFDSSTTQLRSVFKNSIDAEIDISSSILDYGLIANMDFGNHSEYAFQLTLSHELEVTRRINISPTIRGAWGEQNGALIALRQTLVQKQNKKGKAVTKAVTSKSSSVKNILSVLDYEFSLPSEIHMGRFEILSSITVICPCDVLDGSREAPFLNAGLMLRWDRILKQSR